MEQSKPIPPKNRRTTANQLTGIILRTPLLGRASPRGHDLAVLGVMPSCARVLPAETIDLVSLDHACNARSQRLSDLLAGLVVLPLNGRWRA